MEWSPETPSEARENIAYQVLQEYVQALQDTDGLKAILSEGVILDYFGDVFKGEAAVSQHIIKHLHESNYEVSSVTVSNELEALNDSVCEDIAKVNIAEDVSGVTLMTPPRGGFPGLSFATPNLKKPSVKRKRQWRDASLDDLIGNLKRSKLQSETKATNNNEATQPPTDLHHLLAQGTIRYPKRRTPTSDPKRLKRSGSTPRDRYCKLHLGFQATPTKSGLKAPRCKIWAIKYNVSSHYTPRNLLSSFDAAE